MILQICGHLIDTQYIYEITEVKTSFYDIYHGYGCSGAFNINFLNQKSILIELNSNGVEYKTMHTPEYKKAEAKISRQLNDARDQLVTKWKANQLAIPKIEFI